MIGIMRSRSFEVALAAQYGGNPLVRHVAVALGADSIEICPKEQLGGFDGLAASDLQQLASEFTTPIAVDPNPTRLPLPCAGFY